MKLKIGESSYMKNGRDILLKDQTIEIDEVPKGKKRIDTICFNTESMKYEIQKGMEIKKYNYIYIFAIILFIISMCFIYILK